MKSKPGVVKMESYVYFSWSGIGLDIANEKSLDIGTVHISVCLNPD